MRVSLEPDLTGLDDPFPPPAKAEHVPLQGVWTRESVLGLLRGVGLVEGDVVLVHAAMSAFGYVAGGASVVLSALEDAVGRNGALVMPAFTGDNSDPRRWRAPPVADQATRRAILENTPPFDAARSLPWSRVGRLPVEAVLREGAVRSSHPQLSFVGVGARARALLRPESRDWDFPFGTSGVLEALRAAGAKVLFLGTSWNTCTAFHLVEHLLLNPVPDALRYDDVSVVVQDGRRAYARYALMKLDTSDFETLGAKLESLAPQVYAPRAFLSGQRPVRAFPLPDLVETATPLLAALRGWGPPRG